MQKANKTTPLSNPYTRKVQSASAVECRVYIKNYLYVLDKYTVYPITIPIGPFGTEPVQDLQSVVRSALPSTPPKWDPLSGLREVRLNNISVAFDEA